MDVAFNIKDGEGLIVKSKDIYQLFEAQQELFEVAMNPANLKKLASQIEGAKVGMEFEMVVPNVDIDGEDSFESERDYDQDERVADINDVCRFFYDGDYNGSGAIDRLRDELTNKYYDWQGEKISELWTEEGEEYFARWAKENVSDDEVAEYLEKEEDLFGEAVPTKEDWNKFIEENFEEQTTLYYKAEEAFREEKQDEGDFDQEEFLNDIGIRYMTDVENNVRTNITWPHWTSYDYDSGSGEGIETIGDDFSNAIGKNVYSSSSYHGARRSPTAYSLEPDSSINHDDDEAGLEFISHPMPVDEMLEDLEKVKKWADEKGCYTNKSTGLHINVSIPNYSLDKLDFVKLAILLGDQYVLEQFGRLSNGYAKSALEIVKNQSKNFNETDKLLGQLKDNVEGIASKILHSGRTDKYTSINTKDKYVEFRSAGGDWLGKDFNKIKDTVLRFVVALDAACDKEKYKKEYYKALYKVLKPNDDKSDMSMFAKYMSGEITRQQYARSIEIARTKRFEEKGIKILNINDVEENDWVVTYDDGKKSETIYIQNTQSVNTDEQVLDAAKKFKPQWFRPETEKFITVERFKFDEKFNSLKLYQANINNSVIGVVASNEEEAIELLKIMLAPSLGSMTRPVKIEVIDTVEKSKRKIRDMLKWQEERIEAGKEWLSSDKIWKVRPYAGEPFMVTGKTREEATRIAQMFDPDITPENSPIYVYDSEPDESYYNSVHQQQRERLAVVKQNRREREQAAQTQSSTTEPTPQPEQPATDTDAPTRIRLSDIGRYQVTNNDTGGYVNIAATSVDDAINQARRYWSDADLDARRLY